MENTLEFKKLTAADLEQIEGAEQTFSVEAEAEDSSGNKASAKAGEQ